MEVLNGSDGKPSVVETDGPRHGGHRGGYDDRSEFNARFYADALNSGQQFAAAQVSQAGVSKDVAILSKDVVITEGRLAVQIGTVTKDIALLNRDLALTEARLTLVAAQNAAAAAECCCDLKALILQQNGATRDLMQSDRIRELELKLAANGLGK